MKKTRKKSIRRFLALALALVVWVSSVPSDTLAAEINHIHNEEGWTCTQTEGSKTLVCEETEHQHSDDCFTESQGELICENEEADHEHTADCYSSSGKKLVCEQSEHTHTDDCYEIVEGEWNCVKEESQEESKPDEEEDQTPEETGDLYILRFSVEGTGTVEILAGGENVDVSTYVKEIAKEEEFQFSLIPGEGTEIKGVSANGAEVGKMDGTENDYAVRNASGNEVIVTVEAGEAEVVTDETEIPEAVQAFLNAVSALPSVDQISPENAEAVGNQVNAVLDMWEALDDSFIEREDVTKALETVYAIYEAVLAAEEIDDAACLASGYVPVENVGIYPDKKPAGNTATGKVRNSNQSLTMLVGQRASFLLGAPTNTLYCGTHGYVFAEYNPSDYCDISLIDNSGQNLVGNPTYQAGNNSGTRVFDTQFEALKPGTSDDVRVCYYANFGIVFTNGANSIKLVCPYGYYGHYVTVNKDIKWYRYNDVFGITVNARYQLNYDLNGGTGNIASTTKDAANTSATLNVTSAIPTKTGYTFIGWAEKPNATAEEVVNSVTLNWEEGYGSASNPVSKTLYAVWEEDTENEDTTYKIVREYYINDTNVAKVTVAEKDGKVGDEIVGSELAKNNPDWKYYKIDGKRLEFTYTESSPEKLVLEKDKEKNVITLRYDRTVSEETTYRIDREYYINDVKVATDTGKSQNGTVGDEFAGDTLAAENPEWSNYEIEGTALEFTYTESSPKKLVLEKDKENVITLRYDRKESAPSPTVTPTVEPTSTPTATPTATPTVEPTSTPTAEPTSAPTAEPTATPGGTEPTTAPTSAPTTAPTTEPTSVPTTEPTSAPTTEPTTAPTTEPTSAPTTEPTSAPTTAPTTAPTSAPTTEPTSAPTTAPTAAPTSVPTTAPTSAPTPAPEVPANPTVPEEPTTPTEPEEPEPPAPPVIRVVPEIPPVVTPQSPDMLVVIPDEDVARAVVYERTQDPVTEELSYEVNENVPVLEEVPEVVEEESPDTVIIIDEDVPQSYVKVQDPDTEDYVYIPEEEVPLASIGTPQTGDNSNGNSWMMLFMISLGGMIFLVPDLKRRKKNR